MNILRTEFRLLCQAQDARCWLCGGAIDYLLRDGYDAFELDHYFPVSTHRQYEEDPANFRPSHRSCNRSRGTARPSSGQAQPRAPGRNRAQHSPPNNVFGGLCSIGLA
jgi:5-methylcytosine-specific restriction endonuclease McrA